VGFINSDGRYVVVLKATAGDTFSISGLPPGTYGIKYTTDAAFDRDWPDQIITSGQLLTSSIPAAGVITIYSKSAPLPGDANGDGKVDVLDLKAVLTGWLQRVPNINPASLNQYVDTMVNSLDFTVVVKRLP